jgi:hypothetical protein
MGWNYIPVTAGGFDLAESLIYEVPDLDLVVLGNVEEHSRTYMLDKAERLAEAIHAAQLPAWVYLVSAQLPAQSIAAVFKKFDIPILSSDDSDFVSVIQKYWEARCEAAQAKEENCTQALQNARAQEELAFMDL